MQARRVFPQNLAGIQKRLHNLGQIRHTLDELMDPPVEPDCADHANLETKVAQQAADVALNSESEPRRVLRRLIGLDSIRPPA